MNLDVCAIGPTRSLPRCELTDLPRLLCGCAEHVRWNAELDYDDLTPAEHEYHRTRDQHPVFLSLTTLTAVKPIPQYEAEPWTAGKNPALPDTGQKCDVFRKRPAGDAFVCPDCLDDLRMHLGDVPGLLDDLDVLANRESVVNGRAREQKRAESTRWDTALHDPEAFEQNVRTEDGTRLRKFSVGEHQGRLLASRGFNRPLHVHRAVAARDELTEQVIGAVKTAKGAKGKITVGDIRAASRALLHPHLLAKIAASPDGPQVCCNLTAAHKQAMRAIDNVEDGIYIGVCDTESCHAGMYAEPDQLEHKCTTCGTTYLVEARLEQQRTKVLDSLLSIGETAKFSTHDPKLFGRRVHKKQLQRWVEQHRLVQAGSKPNPGHDDTPLYRASDVLVLVEQRSIR